MLELVAAGDPNAERDLITQFLRTNDDDLAALAAAAAQADWGEPRRLAHRIKGAAHTMGAERLLQACEQLEAR